MAWASPTSSAKWCRPCGCLAFACRSLRSLRVEVLQYMCEKDNPGIRDGTKRGNQNTAGGEEEP